MLYEMFEEFIDALTNWSILAFELVGIIILIITGIRGVRDYITHNPQIRLLLAEGMALALEFKLGSEILRTVIVRQMSELVFIAGIIILRASLTFLIHWEIDYEEKNSAKTDELANDGDVIDETAKKPGLLGARFGMTEKRIRDKARAKYAGNQEATKS